MNTIYKIKRFSILSEEQKEFAITSINELMNNGGGSEFDLPSLDLLKLIEMYKYDNGKHVEHWLGLISDTALEISKANISPQILFCWIENDKNILSKVLGQNHAINFRDKYSNSYEFLFHLQDRLLNDEEQSSKKYYNRFKGSRKNFIFEDDHDRYLNCFKYIALCISGQLVPNEPGDFDNMINDSRFRNMKINYKINKRYTKENLMNIIDKCVKDILYIYEEN